MLECCLTCRFWEWHESYSKEGWRDDNEGGAGYAPCRRNPPVMNPGLADSIGEFSQVGFFPTTDADEWCGEYRQGDNAQYRLDLLKKLAPATLVDIDKLVNESK